jgi:Flp pilus assembly protein TadG
MRPNRLKFSSKKEGAQGMVEFALVLPILLLVVLGIIEFGRLLFIYSSVTSASREAARYGAAAGQVGSGYRFDDCDGIRAAAKRIGSFAGVTDANIQIHYDDGTTVYSTNCPPSVAVSRADRILVTVSATFQPFESLVNLPAIPISSTTARTIIKDIGIEGTPGPTAAPPGFKSPTPTITNTPTNTATSTATTEYTPTNTPTKTNTPTATKTATPGPTSTPTKTATPTETGVPTDTPTSTNTPPPTFTPSPTPLPRCSVAPNYPTITKGFTYYEKSNKDFYSMYLAINNDTGNPPVTLTKVELIWPLGAQGSEAKLLEIRFDTGKTDQTASCGGIECPWTAGGADVLPDYFSVCSNGCDDNFDGGADLSLNGDRTQEFRFVFSRPLPSGFYYTKIEFDGICYVETSINH